MASGRKFDGEIKARVVRMYLKRRGEVPGESETASRKHGRQLGHDAALIQHEIEARLQGPGPRWRSNEEVKMLRRENAELRRANAILKSSLGFLRGEIAGAQIAFF